MSDKWLSCLRTADAESGYDLATKLSRMAIKYIQPIEEIINNLRPKYSENVDSLIASSQVIAVNFQTGRGCQ